MGEMHRVGKRCQDLFVIFYLFFTSAGKQVAALGGAGSQQVMGHPTATWIPLVRGALYALPLYKPNYGESH